MSAVFKRDMVKNRNDTLRLNRKKIHSISRHSSNGTVGKSFTLYNPWGSADPPAPLNDATDPDTFSRFDAIPHV